MIELEENRIFYHFWLWKCLLNIVIGILTLILNYLEKSKFQLFQMRWHHKQIEHRKKTNTADLPHKLLHRVYFPDEEKTSN